MTEFITYSLNQHLLLSFTSIMTCSLTVIYGDFVTLLLSVKMLMRFYMYSCTDHTDADNKL